MENFDRKYQIKPSSSENKPFSDKTFRGEASSLLRDAEKEELPTKTKASDSRQSEHTALEQSDCVQNACAPRSGNPQGENKLRQSGSLGNNALSSGDFQGKASLSGNPQSNNASLSVNPQGKNIGRQGSPMGNSVPQTGYPMGSNVPRQGIPMGNNAPQTGYPMGNNVPRQGNSMGNSTPQTGYPQYANNTVPQRDSNKNSDRRTKKNASGIASFVLGIVSTICGMFCMPLVAVAASANIAMFITMMSFMIFFSLFCCGVAAIVTGAIGLKSDYKSLSVTGLVFGCLAILGILIESLGACSLIALIAAS